MLLKEDSLAPEERRRYLETAARHSERLGNLISELFELSKLDSREIELQMESFSLAELVQDVVQDFQLAAKEKGVSLNADYDPELPFVRGDLRLVARVLENLVDNALRHTPPRGSVTLKLLPDGGKVCVEVRDTGCGVSPKDIEHIFDRFYRGTTSGSDDTGGAGLGLAIAKRIVELHGNAIEAESRLNEGTTIRFCL
jgi:signal transduction histidine kinase